MYDNEGYYTEDVRDHPSVMRGGRREAEVHAERAANLFWGGAPPGSRRGGGSAEHAARASHLFWGGAPPGRRGGGGRGGAGGPMRQHADDDSGGIMPAGGRGGSRRMPRIL